MNINEFERQYKALANGKRLAILKHLSSTQRASVGQIAKEVGLTLKATSKHLGILSAIDALEKSKQSSLVFYSLAKKQKPALKHFLNVIKN